MQIETVLLDEIRPNPKNPRRHPAAAIADLVESIKEFGYTAPVLLSADGVILAGHARVKAARVAGMTEVPVIRLDLSGEKADSYMLADNRLAQGSRWDVPRLKDLLAELKSLNIPGFTGEEKIDPVKVLTEQIANEREVEIGRRTVEEIIEHVRARLDELARAAPARLNDALGVIVPLNKGTRSLFVLVDPGVKDTISELQRYVDAGEHSPLECLLKSIFWMDGADTLQGTAEGSTLFTS